MISYEFGDVVLVPFPFTDQTATKRRPAIIVSSAAYHRERPDIILIAVTSQIRASATVGEVVINSWQEAGLIKASVIKPILTTVEKGLVIRKIGQLLEEDQRALRTALSIILGK